MDIQQFIDQVVTISRKKGFRIETNRDGLTQIDFGNKKLHARHLREMFPEILEDGVTILTIIEKVAPGRPCTFKPMKEIITEIKNPDMSPQMLRSVEAQPNPLSDPTP